MSFLIGGFYSLILGLGVIFLLEPIFTFFHHKLPENQIFPFTTGLFLIGVGYMLVKGAQQPEQSIHVGIGSMFVRLVYVIFVLINLPKIELLYIILAFTDAITGLFILGAIYNNLYGSLPLKS